MARWGEHDQQECKVGFDGSRRDKVRLVREIVAFANSGGGDLVYGVADSGEIVGLDQRSTSLLDPADVGNYLRRYLGPQQVAFQVSVREEDGRTLALIAIEGHARPPVVMERDGTCGDGTDQQTLFRTGDILTRDATKATVARQPDVERWLLAAERRGERRAYDLMRRIADRPAGFEVVLAPPETPAGRMNAAADAFSADPSKLLDGDDLLGAAIDTDELELSSAHELVPRLLLQSALRKRATLWWWLVELEPTATWVETELRTVPGARDRDVSDAGKAVLEVAAVLCPDAFSELHSELAGSEKYAHFRDAAAQYPTVEATRSALRQRVDRVGRLATRAETLQAFVDASQAQGSRRGPLGRATRFSLARWANHAGLGEG